VPKKKLPNTLGIVWTKIASMHPSPHIKMVSKLISNKRKQEKTCNLPSSIFKIPTIYMTSRSKLEGTTDN
jgi:hypothetical protein